MNAAVRQSRLRGTAALVVLAAAFLVLVGLGTWQVQRLHWKEQLIARIDERMRAEPVSLGEAEALFARTGDVDYVPVTVSGTFLHAAERHFFATWQGQSGFYVYTPLALQDGRFVFVNRGFVPYDRKDPATRMQGQVEGEVTLGGLARNPVAEKPSLIMPDNNLAKNIFYWKDLAAMAASAGLPQNADVLPFFIDSGPVAVPGRIPVGGVTIVDLPNNHLQYAITWYGLAGALLLVAGAWFLRRRRLEGEARP